VMEAMEKSGAIETRPGEDDPSAIELMRKLARVSRRRWPADGPGEPRAVPVQ